MATRVANTGSGARTANAQTARSDAGAMHRYIVVAPRDIDSARLEAIADDLATTPPRLQLQPDAYLAFAELAVLERAQRSRSAWGLARVERLGLALTEDAALDAPGRAALRAVAARILPTARIVELSAARDPGTVDPVVGEVATALDTDTGYDDVDDDVGALPFEPRQQDPPTELEATQITAEELAMLLDDEGEER